MNLTRSAGITPMPSLWNDLPTFGVDADALIPISAPMTQSKFRILIVEDSILIAMDVADNVELCGCKVVGPAPSVADALGLIDGGVPAAAILDVNLGDERVWPVADRLSELGVPFMLSTGYGMEDIPDRFADRPCSTKPLASNALRQFLESQGLVTPQSAKSRA